MSSTASTTRAHRITVAAAQIHGALDEVVEQSTWSMSEEETRSTLAELSRAEARLAELTLRLAAHAESTRVGDESGATSTAAWWSTVTHQTTVDAHRKTRLAMALDTDRHAPVRQALATGGLLLDQAAVVIRAVDALPEGLDIDQARQAQAWLLEQAEHFDAHHLRVLGKRLVEVIDPEGAEAHEAKILEKEEAAARAAASLRMADDGHGRTRGTFTIPTLAGAILKKALLAIAAPKHRAAVDGHAPVPGRPSDHRMGEAFVELLERYPVDRLPRAGGVAATVVVTATLDALRRDLGVAHLDTGERLSASATRHLACQAGIIPAVLGGQSQVLDLGRKRRFHTEAQRIAAGIQQGGCRAEGCDRPPGMCHLHHPRPWSRGGHTSRDGILLCPRHHTLAHRNGYDLTHHPGGKITFHRRT